MITDMFQSSTLGQATIQPGASPLAQNGSLPHLTQNQLGGGLNSNLMGNSFEKGISSVGNQFSCSDNLFVANLQSVSLEKLVRSKLEVLFQQQKESEVDLSGLYKIVVEQVEKPLLELALRCFNGNQVKTAKMLGINRNTLKKKIDTYKIKVSRGKA